MVNIRFERIANRAANPTLAADGLGHVCALRPELKALSMYCISGLVCERRSGTARFWG